MSKKEENKLPKRCYAFIDGSFNQDTKVYGCGGFLIDHHKKKHIIKESGKDPELSRMRNVAGELLGSITAANLALELGMKSLKIFYDYDGVEKWVNGEWRCNKKATAAYRDAILHIIKSGVKITFQHVKGHAGILENEEADRIAKYAVGITPRKERIEQRNDCNTMSVVR